MGTDVEHIRRSSALFLLKLKEQRRITQVAIDDIVQGCQGLLSVTIDRVQAIIKAKLAESGVDLNQIEGLDDSFKQVIDPFEGIETCHLQERYFRETLGLIVSCRGTYMYLYTDHCIGASPPPTTQFSRAINVLHTCICI